MHGKRGTHDGGIEAYTEKHGQPGVPVDGGGDWLVFFRVICPPPLNWYKSSQTINKHASLEEQEL